MQSQGKGRLYVVGTGPGSPDLLTLRAKKALEDSDYIIGHKRYVELIEDIETDAEIITSTMGREVERVKLAFELSKENIVSLISGGDPGIYGMSGLVSEFLYEGEEAEVEFVPGISAFSIANGILGSPISNDFAVVSLSDLLLPWEEIKKRLECALLGDFVIAIYNPSSRKRRGRFDEAVEIINKYRKGCFVGIVKNASREGEEDIICKCEELERYSEFVNMSTILIVGNSKTKFNGNEIMFTPRGYKI